MQQTTVQPDKTADLSGLRCPHLLLAVIDLVRNLEAEYAQSQIASPTLKILATDLNAPSSISSWARQSGCELADMYDENGTFVFILHCRHHSQSQIDRT
ncbi:MAG: sulfurtransferase TusA family protein [Anaerolineae bacterium]|nr:sulfurtransferase TusA family protein [Anaerolineae bacterium]